MKVYIVMKYHDDDSVGIDSVHATRATAEDRASELDAEVRAWRKPARGLEVVEVNEHDVIGGEGGA